MTNDELLEMARELNGRGEAYALVTVVRAIAPTSAYLGARRSSLPTGHCTAGSAAAARRTSSSAPRKSAIDERRAEARAHQQRSDPSRRGCRATTRCPAPATAAIELFIQPYSARSALCVLGSTPAADEARFLAERLRIRLTDTPGEAPVVLVATQGQGDEEALEAALRSPAQACADDREPAQGGEAADVMRMRGIDEAQLARLQAPAGPDAGAKTPGEIALVAIVGVLALLRGRGQCPRTGGPVQQERRRGRPDSPVCAAPRTCRGSRLEGRFINPVCGMAVSTADADAHRAATTAWPTTSAATAAGRVPQGARQVRGDPRCRPGRGGARRRGVGLRR